MPMARKTVEMTGAIVKKTESRAEHLVLVSKKLILSQIQGFCRTADEEGSRYHRLHRLHSSKCG